MDLIVSLLYFHQKSFCRDCGSEYFCKGNMVLIRRQSFKVMRTKIVADSC